MNGFKINSIPPKLPERIGMLDEVPRLLQPLFEGCPNFEGLRLNHAGRQLQRLRVQREADPHAPFVPPAKPVPISAADFSVVLGAAAPEERAALMRFAAQGRLKVER